MNTLLKPLGYAAAFALLWGVLAWNSPSTTYHIAPLIVAAAVPGILVMADEKVPTRMLALAGVAGGLLALLTTAALGVSDRLIGPSLLPFGGAVTEAFLFTLAAGLVAVAAAATVAARRP